MKKNPEATAKTREKIVESFRKLYREKGMSHVTVGDIAKNAGINRSTFYEYFSDTYDLLFQMEEKIINAALSKIDQKVTEGSLYDLAGFSKACAEIFSDYGDEVLYLISAKGDPAFADMIRTRVLPAMLPALGLSGDEPYFDYMAAFVFSAMMGMISHWQEKGQDISADELMKIAQSLALKGVVGFTGKTILGVAG